MLCRYSLQRSHLLTYVVGVWHLGTNLHYFMQTSHVVYEERSRNCAEVEGQVPSDMQNVFQLDSCPNAWFMYELRL